MELKELEQKVTALREIMEARFTPEKYAEERQKLFDEIMAKVHPPTRQMKFSVSTGSQDDAEKLHLGQFLKATIPGKMEFMTNEVREAVKKTVMSEGDNAQGGYTVPVEYSNEIIKLEQSMSILRRLARVFPMASLTRRLPRQLTGVTVTWTGEDVVKTRTKPTFGQLVQTAKKLAAVVPMTDELLEDNSVDLDRFIMELIAEAMSLEEDRVGFAGNTGAGDPFMGVLYAANVNVVAMAGATIDFDDLVDLIMGVGAAYRTGGTLITSTTGLQAIMKVKDAQGRYLWQLPGEGQIPRIWTYPYEISDQIPVNLGGGAQTAILFGNWKKYFFLSDRGGYEVVSTNSGSDWIGGALESAFMKDETWFRFKKRMSLDVAQPVGFSRMLIA